MYIAVNFIRVILLVVKYIPFVQECVVEHGEKFSHQRINCQQFAQSQESFNKSLFPWNVTLAMAEIVGKCR